jgi:phosphatidate cytidylyltransferase
MSLRKRLPTALVLLVLFFLVVQFVPPPGYFVVLQILILASLFEFYNLFRYRKLFPEKILGVILALTISLSFYFKEEIPLGMVLFGCLLLAALYFVISFNTVEKLAHFPSSIALTFFGAVYLSFTLNYFYLLREEETPLYVYFLLIVIIFGDTGAYFFGKLFGRHKLVPIASPYKTWEGCFGGIVFAALGALAAQQFLLTDIVLWKAVLTGILVHAVAQISDPLESLFKRAVGVKDSSNALPGHGGFLDRVDSLILATPFFYYFIKYFWS